MEMRSNVWLNEGEIMMHEQKSRVENIMIQSFASYGVDGVGY